MWRREKKKKKRRGKDKARNEVKNTKFTPREYQWLWFREEYTNTRGIEWFSGLRDLNNLGHWITMKISLHYFILVGQVEGNSYITSTFIWKLLDEGQKSKWA